MKSFDQRVEEAMIEYLAVQNDARALYELGLRLPVDVKEAVFRKVHPNYREVILVDSSEAAPKVSRRPWLQVVVGSGIAASLLFGAYWLGLKSGTQSGYLEAADFAIAGTETTMGFDGFPLASPSSHSVTGPEVTFRFEGGKSGTITVTPRDDASNSAETITITLRAYEEKSIRLAQGKGKYRLYLVTATVEGQDDPLTRTIFVLFPN